MEPIEPFRLPEWEQLSKSWRDAVLGPSLFSAEDCVEEPIEDQLVCLEGAIYDLERAIYDLERYPHSYLRMDPDGQLLFPAIVPAMDQQESERHLESLKNTLNWLIEKSS